MTAATAPTVTVVGSVNLDLVAGVAALPEPGETIKARSFARTPGGKGANQALAARRMGADVTLLACVGDDAMAADALALLDAGGVDLGAVKVAASTPTGIALITVDAAGENSIVVVAGANEQLLPQDVPDLTTDGVVCQFEVPTATIEAAAERTTGLLCLNVAPSVPVPPELLQRADVVVVNEVERRALGDALDGCEALVVITLGAAGAVAYRYGREIASARPPSVDAIDAVGAGDAFVGALVVRLLEGADVEVALGAACVAGALTTTVRGAQQALPRRDRVDAALEQRRISRSDA